MNIKKFSKIINFFKTKHMKNIELADKNFYKALEYDNLSNDTLEYISTYINSGFKVKKSHSYIVKEKKQYSGYFMDENKKLIEDPFFYVWYIIVRHNYKITSKDKENNYNASDCNIEKEQNKINEILEFIWEKGIDETYKNTIKKEHLILKEFIKFSEAEAFVSIRNSFINMRGFKYYINEIGIDNLKNKELSIFKTALTNCANTLKSYTNVYQEEKKYVNDLISSIEIKSKNFKFNEETKFDEEILNSLYNNKKNNSSKKPSKINEKDLEESKETLNMIKTLKLLSKNFTEKDKDTKLMFDNILEDIKSIVTAEKYIKDIEVKVEINNLLHKHLPETLSNYFDLPEKYRFDFKDNNNNTPQSIFLDTLHKIQGKVTYHLDSIYNENFTNLKIKNRFMKAF